MSENTDQKYTFIGIGNTNNEYIYQVNSKSDLTKVYTIRVKIVDDDLFDTNVHSIECECLGYKHRERCYHIDMIREAIDHNSYCIMCLTTFLDIRLVNSIAGVSAYDQDGKKILINKAGSLSCHEDCIPYLQIDNEIYKSFFNNDDDIITKIIYNDTENSKDLYLNLKKSECEKNE